MPARDVQPAGRVHHERRQPGRSPCASPRCRARPCWWPALRSQCSRSPRPA